MSDKLSTLTAQDIAEFKTREAKAIASLKQSADSYQEFTAEFVAICKRELWRAKYKTKEEFISGLRDLIGISRSQFFKKIHAEEIRFQLAKNIKSQSETKNVKSLAKEVDSMSTEALLEIGKAPPDQRPKVFENASRSGSLTKPAIEASAKVIRDERKTTDKDTWPKDSTGTPIPPPAWPFWERRNEVQEDLNQISAIKVKIEKAKKSGDSLYSWIGTPAIDALQNAYTTIANAKLYAVCTKCQGWWDRMAGGGCSSCHNTGLISKHQYEVASPKEIREMREKANRARA